MAIVLCMYLFRILQKVVPEPGHTTMIAVIHTGLVVYIAVERKK